MLFNYSVLHPIATEAIQVLQIIISVKMIFIVLTKIW